MTTTIVIAISFALYAASVTAYCLARYIKDNSEESANV